jgi:hypothetical protein
LIRAALIAAAVQGVAVAALPLLGYFGVELNFHSSNGSLGDTIMTFLAIASLPGSLVVLGAADSWPDWAPITLMVAVNLVAWTLGCYFMIRVIEHWRAESGRGAV